MSMQLLRIADSNSTNAVNFSSVRTLLRGYHKIKLTANSCIALSNSRNAVSNSSRLFGGFAPDFPHYISGKEFKKMKTFIVYDLDSQMPVAVGEQVSAEVRKDEA